MAIDGSEDRSFEAAERHERDLNDAEVREVLADEDDSTIQEIAVTAPVTIDHLMRENRDLQFENDRLWREIGRTRLIADLLRDAADLPAFLRPQV